MCNASILIAHISQIEVQDKNESGIDEMNKKGCTDKEQNGARYPLELSKQSYHSSSKVQLDLLSVEIFILNAMAES